MLLLLLLLLILFLPVSAILLKPRIQQLGSYRHRQVSGGSNDNDDDASVACCNMVKHTAIIEEVTCCVRLCVVVAAIVSVSIAGELFILVLREFKGLLRTTTSIGM